MVKATSDVVEMSRPYGQAYTVITQAAKKAHLAQDGGLKFDLQL